MDGCSRQDPAYRSAKEGPRTPRGPSTFRRRARPQTPMWGCFLHSGFGRRQIRLRGETALEMPTQTAPPPTRRKSKVEDAYCPHCHLLIEKGVGEEWPKEPQRCPHCRLLVGTGRARSEPSAEPGARGSAAGVFAHEAKRSGPERRVSKETVCRAIRSVAEGIGARPERLLMVDYQQYVSDDVYARHAGRARGCESPVESDGSNHKPRATAPPRGGVGRKPEAKPRPEGHEPHREAGRPGRVSTTRAKPVAIKWPSRKCGGCAGKVGWPYPGRPAGVSASTRVARHRGRKRPRSPARSQQRSY